MSTIAANHRYSKYCEAIEVALANKGHATNAELLEELRKTYPKLSATTIHRATSRLEGRGLIAVAPPLHDGSARYDTNIDPHDHFICTSCGILRDTDIKDKVTTILETSIADCHISGRLTIGGLCSLCRDTPI